jgi:uncharacterized protein
MSNGPIPPQVDPRKLADRGVTLEGELALANMPRVCEQLLSDAGVVRVRLGFSRDEQRAVVISAVLDTEVQMICQRCLEPAVLPIHSESMLAVVREEAEHRALPKGYDVLEVGDDPLDLLTLVEDELLLALPIVPVHEPEVCQQPAGLAEQQPGQNEVKRSNPFGVLAQLKRDPNV